MAISPIEALFRKSDAYKEGLAEFELSAQARLAAIKDEYEALSAALDGAPTAPTKKTAAPAKKAAAPKLAALPDPEPELAPVVEDVDDQAWVVEPDDAEQDVPEAEGVVDLGEVEGVWDDDGEPDEY